MNAVAFFETHTLPYLLVFVRVSGIFILTPIFSVQEVSLQVKGYVAATLALVLYPLAAPHLPVVTALDLRTILLFGDSLLIGLLVGLVLVVYYTAFLLAGEFFSLQMGFGIVNVIDPLSETSIPILGQVKSMFALMVFTIIQGPQMVIEALAYSFQVLPLLTLDSAQPLVAGMLLAIREMFLIGFQIGAPIIATVFLVDLVMGIMSKVAPQLNVMEVGFQLKIVVGLILMVLLLPDVYIISERVFGRSFIVLRGLMRTL